MPSDTFLSKLSDAFGDIEAAFTAMFSELPNMDFSDDEIRRLKSHLVSEYKKAAVRLDPEEWALPRLTLEHLPSWAIQKINEWKARPDANSL